MDPIRFDDLTRLLSGVGGRRSLLRVLFGTVLAGNATESAARKRGQGRRRDTDRDRDKDREREREQDRERLAAQGRGRGQGGKRRKGRKQKRKRGGHAGGGQSTPPPSDCCGTESCADPEPGGARSDCDFAGRSFVGQDHNGSIFRGIDGREANFTATDNRGSVFAEACLQGARFRRAQLGGSTWGGACLFGADFTGVDLGGESAVFAGALFCGTVMPDGRVNDRDCVRTTSCCQREVEPGPACQNASVCADEACQTKACQNGQCVYTAVTDGPDPSGQCSHCCEGECCQSPANQCNPAGLCCAPNCAGRRCGPDGCGGDGICGTCPPGTLCDEEDGQCACTGTNACGPCQTCTDGHCIAVPNNSIACDGSALQMTGPGRFCTTNQGAGVCIDGACSCQFGEYDESSNVCLCPASDRADCAANPAPIQCCAVQSVCTNGVGETGCIECQ